ncbi:MAG TPA: DUF4189 domain-containing protein [Myxococcaceae bacterium]|nr:DUF4189 domain-containing protein [Myxococcaceae bacterium]
MTLGAHRRCTRSRWSWALRVALVCSVLVKSLAAAQQDDPASAWENRCNEALGYVGCAEMMHPGPHRPGPPPKPDVWGALAFSSSTLDWGSSWNSKSESNASELALRQCADKGAQDCKILKTVADVCLALVTSSGDKVFSLGGPIGASNIAEDAALARCRRAGGRACALTTSFCADGVRHVLKGQTTFSNGNPIFVHSGPPKELPIFPVPAPTPGDDTARFYGTWKGHFEANGQTVTMISVHDARGYRNVVVTSTGQVPAGQGSFSAMNGRYTAGAPKPNDSGTYRFTDSETAVCTNSAGQTVTWRRTAKPVDANTAAKALTGYQPPSARPGTLDKR